MEIKPTCFLMLLARNKHKHLSKQSAVVAHVKFINFNRGRQRTLINTSYRIRGRLITYDPPPYSTMTKVYGAAKGQLP